MEIPKEIDAQLRTLEEALTECFGGFRVGDDGALYVECCGPVSYGSGIMGSDIAECQKCHRAVIMVLSPHVSPFLRGDNAVYMPSQEFIEAVGNRRWMVLIP